MGTPAVVQGDRINGICTKHLMPSASGTQPAGPRAFSAPISLGIIPTVKIGGKPAAVISASGMNDNPAHAGIVDGPFAAPAGQIGRITSGSATVKIGGQQAATISSQATCCTGDPGKLAPGIPTVQIG
jgi:uncharacterized Zn-binding protein involved in type VI secretion